jgi:GNAT superfamily N-acetyltransferase
MNETLPLSMVILMPKLIDIPDTVMPEIVKRYKDIRLMGLKLSPSAFGSTYAREVAFNNDTWIGRITNPLGKGFIALGPDNSSNLRVTKGYGEGHSDALTSLLNSPWMGLVTLIGPKLLSPNEPELEQTPWKIFTRENSSAISDLASIKNGHAVYVIVGMYVSPEGRRAGHGRRLVDAAIAAAVEESRNILASKMSVCLEVRRDNIPAAKLYENAGFVRRNIPGALDPEDIDMVWEKSF